MSSHIYRTTGGQGAQRIRNIERFTERKKASSLLFKANAVPGLIYADSPGLERLEGFAKEVASQSREE